MEILSAGEKIKRTRIYKGLTLKDICEDKISVSKMSCIENNKIEAEDWILEIIVEKLGLDMAYIKHGVREQIEENIGRFSENKGNLILDEIFHNIDYAEKYEYHDLTCKLFEILFEYYLNHDMTSELSTTIPRYYNACQKSKDEMLHINYDMYIAKYLYNNKEYSQAGSYIAIVRRKLEKLELKQSIEYIKSTYNQAVIYVQCGKLDKAKEIAEDLKEILFFNKDEAINGEIYKLLSIIEIYLNGDSINKYMEEAFKRYGDMKEKKASAYFDIGEAMILNNMMDTGIDYLMKSLNEYPRQDDKEQLCGLLMNGVKVLISCEKYEEALKYVEEIIDISIELNLMTGMDRGYYYKAFILKSQNNYIMAESYMMLSLDALLKYGSKNEVSKRYMDIGKMYHDMGQTKDSIRYFNLAFKNEKSII